MPPLMVWSGSAAFDPYATLSSVMPRRCCRTGAVPDTRLVRRHGVGFGPDAGAQCAITDEGGARSRRFARPPRGRAFARFGWPVPEAVLCDRAVRRRVRDCEPQPAHRRPTRWGEWLARPASRAASIVSGRVPGESPMASGDRGIPTPSNSRRSDRSAWMFAEPRTALGIVADISEHPLRDAARTAVSRTLGGMMPLLFGNRTCCRVRDCTNRMSA